MRVINRIQEALKVNGMTIDEFCVSLKVWENEEKKKYTAQGKHLKARKLRVTKNHTSILFYKNNPRDKRQPNALTRKAMSEVLGRSQHELFKLLR
jgi:transcriptional regulator with XRE-family HTH domain